VEGWPEHLTRVPGRMQRRTNSRSAQVTEKGFPGLHGEPRDVTSSSARAGPIVGSTSTRTKVQQQETDMPQFVIEREIPGAGRLSQDELRDVSEKSLAVLGELGPDIQWMHSYVTDDKIYCIYFSPNEDLIRDHARKLGVPADRVSAVRGMLDPDKYR
jgi:hypothetical protein